MRIRLWATALFLALFLMAGRSPAETADASTFVQMAAARELPSGLSAKAKLALGPTKAKLIAGDTAGAKAAFGKWLEANKPSDAQAAKITAWLVREALFGRHAKLALASDRARFHAEQVAALDDFLVLLRKLKKSGEPLPKLYQLTLTPAYKQHAAAFAIAQVKTSLSQKELDALIAKIESLLAAAKAEAAKSTTPVQEAVDEDPSAASVITAISKSMHETAKSIISNIKA